MSVLLSGVMTYAYLALVARAVPAGDYASFGAYWSLALLIGSGLSLPLELEVARLAHLRGGGLPPGAGRACTVLTVAAVAAVAVAAPLLLPVLGGSPGLVAALALVALLSPAQFLLRGLLLGRGRYGVYGTVLIADTALRVAGALAVGALVVPTDAADLGWTLPVAIAVAHLPVLATVLRRRGSPAASPDGAGPRMALPAVGHLLVGTLCAQALLNAAPVLVTALADAGGRQSAAAFVAAFTLVRLPLFVAVPLQSALVPTLVDAGVHHRSARRTRVLRRSPAAVAALAAGAAVLGWLAGPWLVALVFGDRYTPVAADVAVLAAGSVVHLALLVAAPAVVAAGRHRDSARAWAAGLAVAAGTAAAVAVVDVMAAAAWAFAAGSAAALTWCAVVLVRTGSAAPADADVPTPAGGAR
ncbi:hypothetical protein ACI79J_06510 [Geodermatophilus sp. SYSU D01062]